MLDRFGFGTQVQADPKSRQEQIDELNEKMKKYHTWLQPHIESAKTKYPDMPEHKIQFQAMSDLISGESGDRSTKEVYDELEKMGLNKIFNEHYNSMLRSMPKIEANYNNMAKRAERLI